MSRSKQLVLADALTFNLEAQQANMAVLMEELRASLDIFAAILTESNKVIFTSARFDGKCSLCHRSSVCC